MELSYQLIFATQNGTKKNKYWLEIKSITGFPGELNRLVGKPKKAWNEDLQLQPNSPDDRRCVIFGKKDDLFFIFPLYLLKLCKYDETVRKTYL
jgi:hypothetical protein